MVSKVNKLIVHTMRPGTNVTAPEKDEAWARILQLHKERKLKAEFSDRGDVNHSPYNFHTVDMYLPTQDATEPKKELILMTIPKDLEEGIPNKEGIVELDVDEVGQLTAVLLLNALSVFDDKRIKIDTVRGQDLKPEYKKMLKGIPAQLAEFRNPAFNTMNKDPKKVRVK